MEVAQGRDRPRAGLNLIEKQERLAGANPLARRQLQLLDQHGWRQITREQWLQGRPLFEVDRGDVPELGLAKLIDGPSLSNLPRAAHDQRLAAGRCFPAPQTLFDTPLQCKPPPCLQKIIPDYKGCL